MQVILRELGDCSIRRAEISDLIPIMEINLKTLPEHYSDYFYESLLVEIPEAFHSCRNWRKTCWLYYV